MFYFKYVVKNLNIKIIFVVEIYLFDNKSDSSIIFS